MAALLFFSAPCGFSLDPSLDISQYAHTAWRIRDGFAQGWIGSIAQTPDGYLWLGTDHGLLRFDGIRTVSWQPPASEQLPSDGIRNLIVARDGTLWIATLRGLASLKHGKLANYPELAGQVLLPMLQDREGRIWFGASDPGRLCSVDAGKVRCYGAGSFGAYVGSIYEDHRGDLWVTGQGGIWRWAPGPPEHYSFPRGVSSVDSIVEDDRGVLLLASNDGLKQLSSGKIREYLLPGGGDHFRFRPNRFLRDRDGGLWIGTQQGLLHWHNGRMDRLTTNEGLSGDFVESIFEDREGSVWVGTLSGLDRFREFAVPTVGTKQGLSTSSTVSVQATPDGSVWIGTPAGLNRCVSGRVTVFGSRTASLRSLGLDDRGELLVSSEEGVSYLQAGRLVRAPDIPGKDTQFIGGDGHGNLWIRDELRGLFHLKPGERDRALPWFAGERRFLGIAFQPDQTQGGLWLGFAEGVSFFKDGQFRYSYTPSQGLGKGAVRDLRFGSRGTLWVSTEGGLSRIEDGHVTTLTSKNGLPCDEVHWSLEDDEHFFWLYTRCGLVRIARSELDAWVSDPQRTIETRVFDASDGVRSASAAGYGPRVTKSADGKVWFITPDGVSVIDPHHLPFNKIPPPVHIEQVTADGKVYDAANGVRLPRLVRYVDIDYTALSLAVPEKVRFRVKLEGEDKDWRELVNVRRVSYTNLGPKHYRFLVKACNNSGVWNEEGAALDFVIPPAWYQTNWFLALCVAAFLALFWAIYQYRLHQMARQFQMTLDTRVAERTRIARDLHDTLLQSFHGVLLFLQSGIHLMAEHPSEGMRTLETAVDQAERAIIEGREAVQGLRASTVERNDLALAIKTFGAELASADSNSPRPEFSVQVEGVPRNLHPILRDEVFRIAGEAMRNTFCHADAKQIEVEIRYDERQLRLRVRDDGKGIDPKVLSDQGREGHYGLRGMRERAKLIGGKLTVWSELDAGTEVELSIPASRAYTAPDGQRSWLAEKFAKFSGKDTELKS